MKSYPLFIFMIAFFLYGQVVSSQTVQIEASATDKFELKVLYDNYASEKGTTEDWGFSCLITADNQQILFDAGAKPDILMQNSEVLKTDLSNLDQIMISHNHWDHIGGLEFVLEKNPDIPVYIPYPPDGQLKKLVSELGGIVKGGEKAFKIAEHIWLNGTASGPFPEQCMVVQHQKGLIVVTGCSHPGISDMLTQIKEDFGQDIYAVIGGFHLMTHSETMIKDIIRDLKDLGVKKCGSTHCTGDKQIQQFRESFGEDFIEMGTGRVIVI